MSQPLKLLIVDDEPLAHQVLLHHLAAETTVQVVAQCYNAAEALAVLAHQPIDLMLLDIQMPVLTGLDMLKVLATPPQVIITSAYAEYALAGFALDVTDYLLKPISGERLAQALEKVRRRRLANSQLSFASAAGALTRSATIPAVPASFIVLKVDRELRKFELASISCFEGYGNYVKVWQGAQMTLVNATLKHIYTQSGSAGFVQVHKSFLVNQQHVIAVDCHKVQLANQQQIKIGEAFKDNARRILAGG